MERLMKPVFCRSLFTVLAFVCCLQAQTLKQIATIDFPGPKGERFDYLTMDDEDHYLLSAHLGPGILYVIDVGTNKLVKAIPGVPGVTGLELTTTRSSSAPSARPRSATILWPIGTSNSAGPFPRFPG
jgi:hypothetical protein